MAKATSVSDARRDKTQKTYETKLKYKGIPSKIKLKNFWGYPKIFRPKNFFGGSQKKFWGVKKFFGGSQKIFWGSKIFLGVAKKFSKFLIF